ncbi:hypothetical protein [Vibrio sp. SCSIO 43140]|nr:hypothetical protein [Vibrio sp. SCSIO 43140]
MSNSTEEQARKEKGFGSQVFGGDSDGATDVLSNFNSNNTK